MMPENRIHLLCGAVAQCLSRQDRYFEHLFSTRTDGALAAWLGIPSFGSDFWDPHWKRNFNSIFDSKDSSRNFFLNSAVEKSRNQNSDSKIQNSGKNGRRSSIHLISHKTSIIIGQPVDITILNRMEVGTIPGKAIFLPIQHLL
jgi:hypothetical protein